MGNKKKRLVNDISRTKNNFVHSLYKMSFKAKEHSFHINIYYINMYQYNQAGGLYMLILFISIYTMYNLHKKQYR